MNTDSTTLYKLMILYMLSKVNFPLSNVQFKCFTAAFFVNGYA